MSIQSIYDAMLEDTCCPKCGAVGMLPNGGFGWVCPNCDCEGFVDDNEDDE